MAGEQWTKSSDEWQHLIVQLLKIRYPLGEFIEVPDTTNGDCGIEGFVRSGIAFQCYAAEEPSETAALTTKQKAKITKDLGKLHDNALALQSILGATQLNRWVFIVPRWEDKSLIAHAEKKANEIRALGLSHIKCDFAPAIATGDDFVIERTKLTISGRDSLRIIFSEVDPSQCQDWADGNDELVANLDRKALAICHGNIGGARKLRGELIKHHLQGKNALEKLRSQYPELYETAFRAKQDKEKFLAVESLIPDSLPPQKMKETLRGLQDELAKNLPGMADLTITQLVHEAVSDWLLRCPLDFPNNGATNGTIS
jgi:hypothetical protein